MAGFLLLFFRLYVNNCPTMTASPSSKQHPPLDKESILQQLSCGSCAGGPELHLFIEVDSTNRVIKQFGGDKVAVLAESQKNGRGRRGRSWVATPHQNILLSVSKTLVRPVTDFGGLSLAAGVSIVDALRDCGVPDVGLKWPNDLMIGRAKLGGVLVETSMLEGQFIRIVIGLGLNVHLSDGDLAELPEETVDLFKHMDRLVDRNRLAANLIRRLYEMLELFEKNGFDSFRHRWESMHVFQQQRVTLLLPQADVTGIAMGVDERGRLMLKSDSGETSYWETGEVSLRA